MLPRLRFFLRRALWAMGRSLGVTALAVVTIGLSLAVLAAFALAVSNLRRIASELGNEVAVSAYLERDALASGRRLSREAASWPGVARAFVFTSTAAMKDFKAQLGPDAVLLEGLSDDELPPSVELRLENRSWRLEEVQAFTGRLSTWPGVTYVSYGQEDIERVAALLRVARGTAFVLGVALSLATILIIYNTIRLTLYARRDEIEIMGLVGATPSFVRAPFVLEGAIQGVLGGAAAAVSIFALEEVLLVGLERGLSFARGSGVDLEFVPPQFAIGLVFAGAGLGLTGSLLAVGKFLKI